MIPNLFLNFESALTDSRPDNLYRISLTEQFENLRLFIDEDNVLDFFRRVFLLNGTELLHFSSPSLNKESSIEKDRHENTFYKNIAIRTLYNREKSLDLILMGDIFEPNRAGTNRYYFIVKGFTLMDSGIKHFGEVTETCRVIVSLSRSENGRTWEDSRNSNMVPMAEWDANLFTRNFISRLLTKYVVENPVDVKTTIDKWDSYLVAKIHKLDAESNYGFTANEIKILLAEKDVRREDKDLDSVPFLKHWYTSGTGEKKVLIHAAFDFKNEYIKSDSRIKRNLDGFMRKSLKIENPDSDPNRKDWNRNAEHIALRDAHISAGREERIEPKDSLNKLENKLKKDKEAARKENKSAFDKDVLSKLKTYENGPLIAELDAYIEQQKERILEITVSETEDKIKAEQEKILKSINDLEEKYNEKSARMEELEKTDEDKRDAKQISSLSKELETLEKEISSKQIASDRSKQSEKYDIDAIVAEKLELIRDEESKSRLDMAKNAYRDDLRPTYDEMLREADEGLKQKYDEEYNTILKNETICRIHYHFSMDVPETSRPEEFRNLIGKRITDYNLKRFKYDDMGDRILLNRQRAALDNFTSGYLMNPFLATFLFNPSANEMNLGEVESFFIENLNESQEEAIRRSISSNGMFLIQGPPGTGKTQVIAEITVQMIKRNKKVMIASENHKAIDNAFDRIPKIPQVRPLRFLSDDRSKDHPYSQEALLDNFYTNIIENLKIRINRFENYEEYRNTFYEKYKKIQVLFSKVQKSESKVSRIKDKKADLELKYRELQKQIREDREEDRALRTRINEGNNAIREIESFEYEDDRFKRTLQGVLEENGVKIPETEDKSEVASRISKMSRLDIIDQIMEIREREEYINLLNEKDGETSPSRIAELNEEIREYENEHNVKSRDLYLFSYFGRDVSSEDVLALQESLKEFKNKETTSLEVRIAEYERMQIGSSEPNEIKLKNLEYDIKDLESDSAYIQHKEFSIQFNTELRNIMQDLEIQTSYKSSEDALELIGDKWQLIQKNQKENANRSRTLIPIYKEIIRYISDESVLKTDKERYTERLTELVNVIGMTCTSRDRMGELDIKTMGADVVIIDEVSKIPFIEILQPLLYGKTAILVGDHKQLPPMYSRIYEKDTDHSIYDTDKINEESDRLFREMYEKSFFEELFNRSPDSYKSSLSTQYRMHPDIMEVVNYFYSSTPLNFGGNPIDKGHHLNITGANGRTIIDEDTHILFVDCKGEQYRESGSTSLSNDNEIKVVSELVRLLNTNCKYDRNKKPIKANRRKFEDDERLSLGIITAYADQARRIKSNRQRLSSFNQDPDERYIVSTVDDFQGDERDIIILSTVRTHGTTPFLEDFRRINVAMSRARRLLIIVGNGAYLQNLKINIDGRRENIYSKIIERIRNMGGYRDDTDVIGGRQS